MNEFKPPKIIIVTTPLRKNPSDFPPVGSLSVITSLKRAGFDSTFFYNIDYLRPTFEEIIRYLKKERPDILGISAVVSTSYAFTKKLSLAIKQALPQITIILGGNLGASAEIVLKKTGVDYICTGEGEKTAVDFVNRWLTTSKKSDFSEVKGLAFLDKKEQLIVTPYPAPISAEEVYDIDWSILEKSGEISFYLSHTEGTKVSFVHDSRATENHRKNKSLVVLMSSKGCVARCTFCHRWDKGIRYIPVPVVMKRIDYMIENHNVGFINFGDENFGTDKRWLGLFLEEIKKRELMWRVAGMRVNCITPDWVIKMKEAGCTGILFGMESGSQKMLDIMEKATTAKQNMDAIKWVVEKKLFTVIQLIIGMPGETPETIRETGALTSHFVEQSPDVDPNGLSINFSQALPGTPLYEIARRRKHIGSSLDDEEQYLLEISDRDARDGKTYINLTSYPQLLLEDWYFEICTRTRMAYINKWGMNRYLETILNSFRFRNLAESQSLVSNLDSGYFASPAREKEIFLETSFLPKNTKLHKIPTVWSLLKQNALSSVSSFYPRFFWYTRHISIVFTFANASRKHGIPFALKMLVEYLSWKLTSFFFAAKKKKPLEYVSLRKLLRKNFFPEIPQDNPAMEPLRKGR